ncbi:MAG: response regulator [Deltaproteobacteria bacterium]|jgi:signal transduction histidine kinase/DNA-binding response OmpR family regulator|nr:response regulator [Deltaproteobacteria bacterium]
MSQSIRPFRVKVFLIVMTIVAAITATTVGASLSFIRNGLQQTILNNLAVIGGFADKLVSTEIDLLKAQMGATSDQLTHTSEKDWPAILDAGLAAEPTFLSLTVLGPDGVAASRGQPPTDLKFLSTAQARRCLGGEAIISTTIRKPGGELVFKICSPLGEKILIAAIPGLHFAELLAPYRIWNSGSLFIIDKDATVIASPDRTLVEGRASPYTHVPGHGDLGSLRAFFEQMIEGGQGQGEYVHDGARRLGAFTAVTGSKSGWILGVSSPLDESPKIFVDRALLVMAGVFLVLGVVAAFFVSGFVANQLKVINHQYEDLSALSDQAQCASEAKTTFLANMSHEMRTPLTAIIGFSELILHGLVESQNQNEHLQQIRKAGLTLLGIVNDILDISKIEHGRFQLICVEYEISSLINDIITINLMRLTDKQVNFNLEIDKLMPSRMIGDELRIKQICNNLLSNAFKYTAEGRVDLSVSGRVEDEVVWLEITVSDTGIGIKPEDVDKLFADYSQLDTKTTRKIAGPGLGLAITKKLVELMDGTIEVNSVYGQGTTFKATIKQLFVTASPIGRRVAENLENLDQLQKKQLSGDLVVSPMPYAKILLVDDVQANLDVAKGMLKPYNLQVDCVRSGQQAVELVREAKVRYDAIFMDHMMLGLDGVEAVRLIRGLDGEYAQNVTIIALTANAVIGAEQLFLANGFQAYLSKPIDMKRMDLVLKRWVRKEQEEATPAPDGPAADRPRLVVKAVDGRDLNDALRRFSGDRAALNDVLRSYAESLRQTLELLREPNAEDLKNYAIAVHGVKSSSYGVGAKQVGAMAEELELKVAQGDLGFVLERNDDFLAAAEKLAAGIVAALAAAQASDSKPSKDEPDPALLSKLAAACTNYDMDGVDAAILELEKFSYKNKPNLTSWLRERVESLDFQGIVNRLSAHI